MNLNLINKYCDEWTRTDWQDAYAQYCKNNMYGPKTKKEYYDFVNERYKRLREHAETPSREFLGNHTRGWQNARLWAKKRGCDMNGRLRSDIAREQRDNDALEVARHAEDIAVDTHQRLEYLIQRVKK